MYIIKMLCHPKALQNPSSALFRALKSFQETPAIISIISTRSLKRWSWALDPYHRSEEAVDVKLDYLMKIDKQQLRALEDELV